MPGADDKVILKIKLETIGVSKELQNLSKEIKALSAAMGALTKSGATGFTSQNKAIKEGTTALKEQERIAKEAGKRKTAAYREDNKQYEQDKKQRRETNNEVIKVEGVLRRFGRGLGIGSGVGRMLQGPEGGHAQRAGQLLGSAPRVLANTALSIGSGLLGFLMGGVQGAYGTYLQVGQAMAPLAGMGMSGRGSRRDLLRSLRASGGAGGVNLGYGPSATYQQAAGVGRATGEINAVYRAQQFAMAGGGMDVGEATGIMGQLRSAGLKFGRGEQKDSAKELGRMIAAGLATGIERPRLGAYLQNIAGTAGEVGLRMPGNVDLKNITSAYGMVAQMGINDPGRARAMVSGLDRMIQAPGAGEAGQALMMQAFGFGRPGGETSYYDALKRQDRGFTGKGGVKNLMDVIGEVNKQYGVAGAGGKGPASEEANLVLKDISGMTLDNVEAIQEMINSGKSQEEIMSKVEEIQKETLPLEKQALEATKQGFSHVAKRIAGLESKNEVIGGRAAKLVEDLQDLQMKALMALTTYLPEIHKALRTIGQIVGEVWDYFKMKDPGGAKKREEDEKKRRITLYDETLQKWAKKPAETLVEKMKEEEELAQRRRYIELGERNKGGKKPGFIGSTLAPDEPVYVKDPSRAGGMRRVWPGDPQYNAEIAKRGVQAVSGETETSGVSEDVKAVNLRMRTMGQGVAYMGRIGIDPRKWKPTPEQELALKQGDLPGFKKLVGEMAATGRLGGKVKAEAAREAAAERLEAIEEEAKKRRKAAEEESRSIGPSGGHSPSGTLMLYDPSDARRLVGGFYTPGQPGGVTGDGSPTGLG